MEWARRIRLGARFCHQLLVISGFFVSLACSEAEPKISGEYHWSSPPWPQKLVRDLLFQQKFVTGAHLNLRLDSSFTLYYPSHSLAGAWKQEGDSLYLYPLLPDSHNGLRPIKPKVLRYKIESSSRLRRPLASKEATHYWEMLEKP